jgi:hypothetical protein
MNASTAASMFIEPRSLWIQRREAALNWLALGLLLAAWNAADGDPAGAARRPQSLRGYSCVSVRALHRVQSSDM